MEKPLARPFFIRNLDAGKLLETFLVSAVAAFLGVRFFLGGTGFPRLGSGGLHIAHMLWGGALMVAGGPPLVCFPWDRGPGGPGRVGRVGVGPLARPLGAVHP